MKKVKLGIVGAGNISRLHLEAARLLAEIELVSIADVAAEKAQSAARRYGLTGYTDYQRMFEQEALDAVIVAVPHHLHKPVTLEAARRGIHPLVEKPLAPSLGDCDEMITAARRHAVRLMVGHVVRFGEAYVKARAIHDSGVFGRLILVNDSRYDYYYAEERLNSRSWFMSKELSGGGVIMNLGVHSIDAIQWLTGSRVRQVLGKTTCCRPEFDVEGSAQLFLELDNGVTATITLNGYGRAAKRETDYVYEQGIVRVCGRTLLFVGGNGDSELEKLELPPEETGYMTAQLKEFVGAVLGDREPAVTGEYGRSVVAVARAAYESSATGRVVPV